MNKRFMNRLVILSVCTLTGLCNQQLAAQPRTVPSAYAQGTPVNYIRTWDATAPETDANTLMTRPLKDVKQTTQYFDGLGRPLQTVTRQGSLPTGGTPVDMVSAVVYDEFGREQYKYLPSPANNTGGNTSINDGLFKFNPFQQNATFMTSQYGSQGETFFYTKTNFEASPLNRVEKVMESGNSWAGSNRGIRKEYTFNEAAETAVRIWNIASAPGSLPISPGVYAPGQLYRNATFDEHNNLSFEYVDKEGRTVLKSIQNGSDWFLTFYVYDDLGNLRCVIPPKAVPAIWSNWIMTQAVMDELCFRYEYDERNRVIIKKVPGAGEVNMVYDTRDRLVMTQDANMRVSNKWLVTKYDALNRPIETGLWVDATAFTTHLTNASASTTYPVTSTGYEELAKTFYDDYSWLAINGNPFSQNRYTGDDAIFYPPSFTDFPYPQPLTQSFQTRGSVTGTKTKVLGTSQYLYSINYYDEKGRVIQTNSQNTTGGGNIMTSQYSFAGQTLVTYQLTGNNQNSQAVGVRCLYNYDDLGRVLNVRKIVYTSFGVSTNEKTIVENEYDALGQLKKKKLAPAYNNNAGLETENYDYNIRGWMLGMNREYAKDANNTNYFGFDLGYDKANNSIIGNQTYANPQYNGNIEGMVWKSKGDGEKRKYDFYYDAANRLLKGDFKQFTNGTFNLDAGVNFSMQMGDGVNAASAYDENGNIKAMKQWGLKLMGSTQIDDMNYSYYANTNKLMAVTEQGTGTTDHKLGDFTDKNTSGVDYGYDLNGNLITDLNKGLNGALGSNVNASGGQGAIRYNHLNLPTEIVIAGKGMIYYTYDAAGNKLKKLVQEDATLANNNISTTTTTLYLDAVTYESKTDNDPNTADYTDRLQFISHEEGRIRFKPANGSIPASFQFDYMLKDHLGNVRMVLTEEQQTDPYPVASMETAQTTTEEVLYSNLNTTRTDKPAGYPTDTYTNPNDKVARVKAAAGSQKIGPAIILKVMAGDKFNIRANSWYKLNGATPGTPVSPLTDLVAALTGSVGSITSTHGGATVAELQSSGVLSPGATSFLNTQTPDITRPKAYLNWMLLDEQFKLVQSSSGAEQVPLESAFGTAPNQTVYTHLRNDLPVNKNGYLYIYVSNETPNIDVFFDNLQVTHIRGPLLSEDHFYPFGLTMSGISSKALGFGSPENKKGYAGNELQSKEFSDGSGLDVYDFNARTYDQQIGRFIQVDPLTEEGGQESWSPYHYSYNNPIRYSDPDGKVPIPIIPIIVAWLISLSAESVATATVVATVTTATAVATADAIVNSKENTGTITLNANASTYNVGSPFLMGTSNQSYSTEVSTSKAKGSNNEKTKESLTTGKEAHRQKQQEVKEQDPGAQIEVPYSLGNGQNLRKDYKKSDGTYGIIKPNTPTGRKAAARREAVMKADGKKTEINYYDPKNPAYQPGSPTYIGPKSNPSQ